MIRTIRASLAACCFEDEVVRAALPVTLDQGAVGSQTPTLVCLARAHHLTVYDVAYLELAMRTGLPLATRDGSLQAAAETVGVSLFEA
jgi:hypothetical protein